MLVRDKPMKGWINEFEYIKIIISQNTSDINLILLSAIILPILIVDKRSQKYETKGELCCLWMCPRLFDRFYIPNVVELFGGCCLFYGSAKTVWMKLQIRALKNFLPEG